MYIPCPSASRRVISDYGQIGGLTFGGIARSSRFGLPYTTPETVRSFFGRACEFDASSSIKYDIPHRHSQARDKAIGSCNSRLGQIAFFLCCWERISFSVCITRLDNRWPFDDRLPVCIFDASSSNRMIFLSSKLEPLNASCHSRFGQIPPTLCCYERISFSVCNTRLDDRWPLSAAADWYRWRIELYPVWISLTPKLKTRVALFPNWDKLQGCHLVVCGGHRVCRKPYTAFYASCNLLTDLILQPIT